MCSSLQLELSSISDSLNMLHLPGSCVPVLDMRERSQAALRVAGDFVKEAEAGPPPARQSSHSMMGC